MKFSRVIMTEQPEIAKVNRKTGVLYLNRNIWDSLPTDQKDFVLLHEQGHLKMQTQDEFQANAYAISKFTPVGKFSNKQLGQRIMVMRQILDKADDHYSGFNADNLLTGAVGGIFESLSILGVGSKARQKETAATAAAQVSLFQAQAQADKEKAKTNTKILIIAGTLLLVGGIVFLTLK